MIFGLKPIVPKILISSTIALLAAISIGDVSGSPVSQTSSVDFTASAATSSLALGDIVELTVQFDASSAPVSAAQAYLNFDQTVLRVVDSTTGTPVTSITPGPVIAGNGWAVLQNRVDNVVGEIDFAAGKSPVGGIDASTLATLATFHFEALATTSGTTVSFDTTPPRQTKAVSAFDDVTGVLPDTILTITNTNDVTFDFSIQGRGSSSGPSWSMPVEVELYPTGGSTSVSSDILSTAASTTNASSVMLPGVLDGTYDVWLKGDTTLSTFKTNVAVSQSSALVSMGEQVGGDATGGVAGAPDNIVDGADYSAFLSIPIGTSTADLPAAQQRQDHNRDAVVDITDYAIIVENFNREGDFKP